jgi:CMP-N-acetylneuraminic acid synthetase
MNPKIAALVPMRHQSDRVPGKNYRPFHGRPLYHYILNTLMSVPSISAIMIDTDSPIIMEDARRNFPTVRVIERPPHLRGGDVPMNEVLLHDVTQLDADWYLQSHSTNPLLKPETVTRAIETFLSKRPEYDSLFSVTRVQTRFWDANGRAVNHNPDLLLRTQDLPPLFEENSSLYLFNRTTIEARRNRIGASPLMFEMDRLEAVDIDEELDFVVAELLYTLTRKMEE